MRLSEFRRSVDTVFGAAYGRVVLRDLVLSELGEKTAEQALAGGAAPREVWAALCDAEGVPLARRHGVGLPAPRD